LKLDELSQGTPACGARRALHARIFQTGIKKLVDEHALLRCQDALQLLAVHASICALQKDCVHLGTEGRARQLRLISQWRRKAFNPVRAWFQ